MTRRPGQGGIEIRHVDDPKADQIFLRFGIRAVVDLPLAMANRDSRRRPRRFESGAPNKDAGRLKGLPIRPPGGERGFVIAIVEMFVWLMNECAYFMILVVVSFRRKLSGLHDDDVQRGPYFDIGAKFSHFIEADRSSEMRAGGNGKIRPIYGARAPGEQRQREESSQVVSGPFG